MLSKNELIKMKQKLTNAANMCDWYSLPIHHQDEVLHAIKMIDTKLMAMNFLKKESAKNKLKKSKIKNKVSYIIKKK